MRRDACGDTAQVALVGCVDERAAVFLGVVLLLQRSGPFLEPDVGDLLLGAGEQADALCGRGIAGLRDSGPHLGSGVLLSLEEVQGVAAKAGPSVYR